MKRSLAYALGGSLPRLPDNIGIDQRDVRPGFCHFQEAWMGHKNIQHTVRYTELAADRFKDFWRE